MSTSSHPHNGTVLDVQRLQTCLLDIRDRRHDDIQKLMEDAEEANECLPATVILLAGDKTARVNVRSPTASDFNRSLVESGSSAPAEVGGDGTRC
jgi:ABC-type taurine transport system ATPase subunit